jgi:hypothetical protein
MPVVDVLMSGSPNLLSGGSIRLGVAVHGWRAPKPIGCVIAPLLAGSSVAELDPTVAPLRAAE